MQVIASDTKGQREVAAYFPAAVCLVDITKPQELVDAIKRLYKTALIDQQDQYKKIFSWETQELKLKNLLVNYL